MLQAELRRTRPDAVGEIHTAASRWFAAEDKSNLAAEHAIASGDTCLAGTLIWQALPEMTGRGRLVTLWRWLDTVGEERFPDCHGLLFTAAHCSILSGAGEEAEHWLAMATALPPREGCEIDIETDLTMLRATLATDGIERMLEDAEQAIELLPPESIWRGAASFYRGVALHLLGEEDAAVTVLRDAARRTASVSPIMQGLSLAQLSLIACDGGDSAAAVRYAAEARAQVERCGLGEYPAMNLVYAAEAMTLALNNQTARAQESRERATRLLNLTVRFPPWYETEARLVLARASLRFGDFAGAADLVRQARERLGSSPDAAVFNSRIASLESSVSEDPARDLPGSPGLTRAELRTLRFLPTHFSFRQIGEQNHVSANTVKTQARAIYTKLGVSSRADAVERARTLGLLDPPG
jgi:LuxR family maltose regulon positive regulatory protein